ncbi:GNAT family N-acetyltransferase [Syntrophobotulus glycolicus]|uniref:GNAT family N-acetyltransferase n=1 Tax=Syntrophobotulus glycolicus TaxID=51197 RepID=UPI00069356D0|nr:GNAT family N-acetyltransferase [Syntrophobotulus glycolicus]
MLEIYYPNNSEDIRNVRFLFEDYANSMGFDLDYQNFNEELEELPGKYSLPHGFLLLAKFNNNAVGCVAIKKIGKKTCEMKRLYVIPSYRR